MTELLPSLAKVTASLALLVLTLGLAAWGMRRFPAELRRKFIHVSLGLYCLTFPLLFSQLWEILLCCALAVGVFSLTRGRLRTGLGAGLHAVERESHGEMHFALAVATLFSLRTSAPESLGQIAAYVLPLAVLTISDAAAALVGGRFGHLRFRVGDGRKSVEGVVAFAVSAWLVSACALTLLTELHAAHIVFLSVAVACVGAAIEAASTRGWDNLFVPVGVHALLAALLNNGFDAALTATFTAAALLTLAALATTTAEPAR
jgi:dolichol kinase